MLCRKIQLRPLHAPASLHGQRPPPSAHHMSSVVVLHSHSSSGATAPSLLSMGSSKSASSRSGCWGLPPPSVAQLLTLLLAAVATVAYRRLERWGWVDSLYASVGVITTVGQLRVAATPAGKLFTAVLNVASLGVTGLAITEVSDARKAWTRQALRLGGSAPSVSLEAACYAAAAVPPWVAASFFFSWAEGWSLAESFYFSLTCATGLGMGDTEPKTVLAKLVLIPYLFATMGVFLNLLSLLGSMQHTSAARSLNSWLRVSLEGSAALPAGEGKAGGEASSAAASSEE
jgi:hypothetical protein